MKAHVSYIMLPVKDVAVSAEFYRQLGFTLQGGGQVMTVAKAGSNAIALFQKDKLTSALGESVTKGLGGAALVHTVVRDPEVDVALKEAANYGGRILRSASHGDWGGYSGAFADPDGHVWIVLNNKELYRD